MAEMVPDLLQAQTLRNKVGGAGVAMPGDMSGTTSIKKGVLVVKLMLFPFSSVKTVPPLGSLVSLSLGLANAIIY